MTQRLPQAQVPSNYLCFKCKTVGEHWIMKCKANKSKRNDNHTDPKANNQVTQSNLSATANEYVPYEHNPYIFINNIFENELEIFYNKSVPSLNYIKHCNELFDFISECISIFNCKDKPLQKWDIFKFGGNIWKVDTKYSDIDMAINIKQDNPSKKTKQDILKNISKIIKQKRKTLIIENILDARYPIITICDEKSQVCIDLSIADKYCKKTTDFILALINNYQERGYPVRKLIIFIKYWSKQCGINDALHFYPNSFGYTLMVINYIQCIIFSKQFIIANDKHLSCLIFGFYSFYGFQFDNNKHAISIINNYDKQFFDKKQTYCVLEIVDPVNLSNNVSKNVGHKEYCNIQFQIRRATQIYSDHIKQINDKNQQSLLALLSQQSL